MWNFQLIYVLDVDYRFYDFIYLLRIILTEFY